MGEEKALQEITLDGLKSMENLVHVASQEHIHQEKIDSKKLSELTLSLRKVVDSPRLIGHARFRRGPVQPRPSECSTEKALTLDVMKSEMVGPVKNEKVQKGFSVHGHSSPITAGGSSSNGTASSFMFLAPAPVIDAGKPPIYKKPARGHDQNHDRSITVFGKSFGSAKPHYKQRKVKANKTIRVPLMNSERAIIPSDEYSWRKYGEKPIEGSPYSRAYYKCTVASGCPARKCIERAKDDPKILIISYNGEHQHPEVAVKPNMDAGVESTRGTM